MADDSYSEVFFKMPAYALVIGISRYQYGQEPDDVEKLSEKNFRNLKVAAKDAKDFASFLTNKGFFPANVQLLTDNDATIKNIKTAFKKLSASCKDPDIKNPLVIVYFSGHGMAEDEENHYLVPYEAERDLLFSTAISNDSFNSLLNGLRTNRLVVFLDACHSGALVGLESQKARDGGTLPLYDYSRGLGGGEGRIVIASCKRGEQSYESADNGIFTGKLLSLLSGSSPHFVDQEEIGVFDLYAKLRVEVLRAAEKEHNKSQEPQINEARESTGIVLAINRRAIRKKEEEDKQAQEKRRDFLDSVLSQLKKMPAPCPDQTIASKLRSYVCQGKRLAGHEPFYRVFEENLDLWRRGDDVIASQCCEILIEEHGQAIDSLRAPEESRPQPSKPDDRLESVQVNTLLGPPDSKTPVTAVPPPDQQILKRVLSPADRDYILEEIRTKLDYWLEQKKLDSSLCQPISQEEFAMTVNSISSKHAGDIWDGILARIVQRFKERWAQAALPASEAKTPLNIRSEKDKR
jgi:uncharacterized caspase-like protein